MIAHTCMLDHVLPPHATMQIELEGVLSPSVYVVKKFLLSSQVPAADAIEHPAAAQGRAPHPGGTGPSSHEEDYGTRRARTAQRATGDSRREAATAVPDATAPHSGLVDVRACLLCDRACAPNFRVV